jgi:hypothetical protein
MNEIATSENESAKDNNQADVLQLIGFNSSRKNFAIFRKLEAKEIVEHKKYTPIISEATNQFNLFRILAQNYSEWNSYVNSLLNATTNHTGNEMLELDRLLLNYLTCAYTIQEHFKVSFQRRFRNDEAKQKERSDFIDGLCKVSWPFAFFLDFRGHVQHCGLGIGEFNRQVNATSVIVNITHDSSKLVAENRDWTRSNLTADKGKLELVPLLYEFHSRMMHHYAGFIAKTFFPELFPAAEFYGRLTEEVRKNDPGFRMYFHRGELSLKTEGDTQTTNLNLSLVANDVFAELGLAVTLGKK